jgi:acetyltransferase-like isoleucine patch superfamily enzyme
MIRLSYLFDFLSGRLMIESNVFIDHDARIDFGSERRKRQAGSLFIGHGSTLCKGSIIALYGGRVHIGRHTYIGPYTVLYGHGGIEIGDNVLIANHSTIVSSAHNYLDPARLIAHQGETFAPVTIENDVWIGSGARILAGVRLCKGSVVGANSVVTKPTPPYSVSYGVPARPQSHRHSAPNT